MLGTGPPTALLPGGTQSHSWEYPSLPVAVPRDPEPCQARFSVHLFLSQQIDELLAGNFTQEDEDAILEELNAITQVQVPRAVWSPGGWDPIGLCLVVCLAVMSEPRVLLS